MSSDLQSVLELILLDNYVSRTTVTHDSANVIGVAIVVYDYNAIFQTLSQCKPWTWVSTMFVVVRYFGLCWVMTFALFCTTFIPGPIQTCIVTFLVSGWTYIVFLSVADLVMILRVYAMWNRSRMILCILLFIYVLQSIVAIILEAMINNPNTYLSVTVAQVLDFSLCNVSYAKTPSALQYIAIPQLILGVALILFAVFQTLKQSVAMYKATKQWQPNRYMQKLVGDGFLYFLVNVLYQVYVMLNTAGTPTTRIGTAHFVGTFVYTVTFYTLIPRFIIGIRELYDGDVRGRPHIDTGFGVQSRSNTGLDTTMSAMVFVDGNHGPEVDGSTDNSNWVECMSQDWTKTPLGGKE
ncbi:hypothetical protein EV363DRAFT_1299274 [Boletus edulis]|nr:hypothetical protein EV363DRAFT_1299274 [Boletus edulis]